MQNTPSLAILLTSDDSGYIDNLMGILEFLVCIRHYVMCNILLNSVA